MSRILCLAKSGFGKTFSIGKVPEINHIGLNPKETFIISVTGKLLIFPNGSNDYKVTTIDKLQEGNRLISNNADIISKVITMLSSPKSPYKNVILDDANYIMQDYYMENALKGGWDTPKKIGVMMDKIFKAIELFESPEKHFIMLAHGEEVLQPDGRIYVKMKTTGKMVDEYITPEGKFDITLVGKSSYDSTNRKIIKQFVTNEDENYSSPKSAYGMLELYVPNDFGYIINKINEFHGIK